MDFETYLKEKKIDPRKFSKGESEQFQYLKGLFEQMHPNSFTAQKLFLINDIRRRFHYEEVSDVEKPKAKILKPKIVPRPKPKDV